MAFSAISRQLANRALDLVFPPRCPGCNRLGVQFCDRCAQRVEPAPDAICLRCGRPQASTVALCADCRVQASPITMARAAALHTTPLREAIHALKYQSRPQLAQYLGRYLVAAFINDPWKAVASSIDVVVPAPLHLKRYNERGYNQSELLAAHLCEACGLTLASALLERTRDTRQQVGLNPIERKQNVDGAFAASPALSGCTVLLIDDVYTTGATLRACAKAAADAGARQVFALTLAIPAHQ